MTARTLAELPTDNVAGIYRYGWSRWSRLPSGHPDNAYYHGMMTRALAELQKRANHELSSIQAL